MSIVIDIGTSGPAVPILPTDWYVPPSIPPSYAPPHLPLRQSLLNMYKDTACTNRISEHWDDSKDSNAISTIKMLPIPFAGTIESGVIVACLLYTLTLP